MDNTTRVRIAVLIDEGGDWAAFGGARVAESNMVSECYGIGIEHDGEAHIVWVEAEVPRPRAPTVEGTAEIAPDPEATE